jgi:hypothetical protein
MTCHFDRMRTVIDNVLWMVCNLVLRMVAQRINLEPLLSLQTLSCDHRDGVQSVRLVSVTLDHRNGCGRFHVTLPFDASCDLCTYLQRHFGTGHAWVSNQFQLIQARLAVQLTAGQRACQTILPIELSLPNICHLPTHPEYGHPIGEAYLRRWGVLAS